MERHIRQRLSNEEVQAEWLARRSDGPALTDLGKAEAVQLGEWLRPRLDRDR